MYKLAVLPNGLKVVTIDMPYMESVALGIWIRSGGRFENSGNNGISHFLEHMVFKGTLRRSGKEIKESIEGIGGTLNGFTGEESTCYFVKVTSEHTDLALDVLSDMALNPKLVKNDIEKEKAVILEEIRMYIDLPNHYVHELLSKLIWPRHPLGMPLAGIPETVKKINQKSLKEFKERFYSPENMLVVCAGRVDAKDFLGKVKRHFKDAEKREIPHSKKFAGKQARPKSNFLYKDTEQTHLALGFHGVSMFHADRYAADLLHVILGGNMSSRLFHEVREKRGLAYDISSSAKHYSDTGSFVISAGLNNRGLPDAVDVIIKELCKIKNKPVSVDEFKRAKEFCRGQLLMALENTLMRMTWVGEKIITRDPLRDIDSVLEMLDKVTIKDITSMAKHTFRKSNINIAVIGPLKESAKAKITGKFHEGLN